MDWAPAQPFEATSASPCRKSYNNPLIFFDENVTKSLSIDIFVIFWHSSGMWKSEGEAVRVFVYQAIPLILGPNPNGLQSPSCLGLKKYLLISQV